MAKPQLRLVCPSTENRTVPRRRKNSDIRTREHLTHDEVQQLIGAAKGNRYGRRDALMIMLTFRHGLRAAEVCDLRWEQMDFKSATLHVRRVKNGTPATHPLTGREMRALRKHQRCVGARRAAHGARLFAHGRACSRRGTRVGARSSRNYRSGPLVRGSRKVTPSSIDGFLQAFARSNTKQRLPSAPKRFFLMSGVNSPTSIRRTPFRQSVAVQDEDETLARFYLHLTEPGSFIEARENFRARYSCRHNSNPRAPD